MIVVPVKEGENIDRALKRFKRKFEKTGVIAEALFIVNNSTNVRY